MEKVKIGLLGAGHLGKIHARCIEQVETLELVGFFDPLDEAAEKMVAELGLRRFTTLEALLEAVQAVDIVTPTTTHFALAQQSIHAGRHIFIEKPVTQTVEEGKILLAESEKNPQLMIQVGHVERFNPAFLALANVPLQPMFIEAHRLATFNPRGTDVSVVLDLMIHDLDIVLSVVSSPLKSVSASGVAVVSHTPDICNARLEFENGCVANLTASRISLKQMRKVRLFQKDAYISLDFLDKQAQIIRLFDEATAATLPPEANLMPLETADGTTKMIQILMPDIAPTNAIKMELETFANSILLGSPVRVKLSDGLRALEVAYRIIEQL